MLCVLVDVPSPYALESFLTGIPAGSMVLPDLSALFIDGLQSGVQGLEVAPGDLEDLIV